MSSRRAGKSGRKEGEGGVMGRGRGGGERESYLVNKQYRKGKIS